MKGKDQGGQQSSSTLPLPLENITYQVYSFTTTSPLFTTTPPTTRCCGRGRGNRGSSERGNEYIPISTVNPTDSVHGSASPIAPAEQSSIMNENYDDGNVQGDSMENVSLGTQPPAQNSNVEPSARLETRVSPTLHILAFNAAMIVLHTIALGYFGCMYM